MSTEQEEPRRARASRLTARATRWIGIVSFLAIMGAAIVLALLNHPVFGARAFALALFGIAALRAVYRDRPVWFAARSWWFDCAVLTCAAIAIVLFSFYGGRVMPSLI